jgi:hypothetical protein
MALAASMLVYRGRYNRGTSSCRGREAKGPIRVTPKRRAKAIGSTRCRTGEAMASDIQRHQHLAGPAKANQRASERTVVMVSGCRPKLQLAARICVRSGCTRPVADWDLSEGWHRVLHKGRNRK